MSSFQISNSTISKLADALRYYSDEIREEYPSTIELAKDLHTMNVKALRERYDDAESLIQPFQFTYENWILLNEKDTAQFFMSLCCYLYQCSAGQSVTETKLYKQLKKIKENLSQKISIDWAHSKGAKWE